MQIKTWLFPIDWSILHVHASGVAGGIALLLEKHPEYTNLEIKKRLKSRARDLGYPHNLQGWGLFSLDDFLRES